jgi:fatty-acyl-CoA synthase
MQMIDGAMQEFSLTLDKFLDHAAKWHPRAQVVTGREDQTMDRVCYADLRARSLRMSTMLRDFGVRFGDRVATLAWNTQAHVETWYAVMGIGATCHTLNPRLTVAQIASMLAQSGCRLIVVSADLVPLARQIVECTPAVMHVLVID